MTLVEQPAAFSVFCDDIRREETSKWIYIGVYTGEMTFNAAAPQAVSICGVFHYIEPRGAEKRSVRFQLLRTSVNEMLVDLEVLNEGERSADIGDDPENRLMIMVPLRITPFVIEGPEALRARWLYGDETVHAGSLRISFADPDDGSVAN